MTTEHDDGLTDEERAALNEDDGGAQTNDNEEQGGSDGQEGKAGEGQGADGSVGDDTGKPDSDAADGKTAGATADATAAAADGGKPQDGEPDKTGAQPAPVLVAPATDQLQGQLTDIQAKKSDLLEKFDAGDLTAKEYQVQLDALSKEERQIERKIDRASLAEDLNRQSVENEWKRLCSDFVDSNPIYKTNERLYRALDSEVRALSEKPETANWSGQKFLQEAHKNLKEAFNLPDAAADKKPGDKRPKTPPPELPPRLDKVPAADIEDTSGNKYAALDRLMDTDPIRYEEMLAKMPAAERDAYMASQ